ncbi:hypothetical protein C8R43DRAFT_1024184 [Mycena crocata]|nr:hypothetical protein C8R43DRAFT_1024184 [Mycena crocata]
MEEEEELPTGGPKKEEDEEGEGDAEVEPERECVLRAMERVVFPPVDIAHAVANASPSGAGNTALLAAPKLARYSPRVAEVEMDVDADIDIVGDGSAPKLAPPSPSTANLALLSTIALETSSISSPLFTSSMNLAAAAPSTMARWPSPSITTATTTKPKPKRLAGPGVPPPSPDAADARRYPSAPMDARHNPLTRHTYHAATYADARRGIDTRSSHADTDPHRWGPLIGATRGVRTAEAVAGSGGWGGVVLVREEQEYGNRDMDGYVDDGAGYSSRAYGHPGRPPAFGEAYASTSAQAGAYASTSASTRANRSYGVRERRGGWEVMPEAAVGRVWDQDRPGEDGDVDVVGDDGVEEDADVDVVGDGTSDGAWILPLYLFCAFFRGLEFPADLSIPDTHARRSQTRRREREPERERAQEDACPPKMRKRWNAGLVSGGPKDRKSTRSESTREQGMPRKHVPTTSTRHPKDKGKEKARAVHEAMDVDVDVVEMDTDTGALNTCESCRFLQRNEKLMALCLARQPPPSPGRLQTHVPTTAFSALALAASALSAGTSPSASFARLSLVSPDLGAGGVRSVWSAPYAVATTAENVDILAPNHGAVLRARRGDEGRDIAAADLDGHAGVNTALPPPAHGPSSADAQVRPSPSPRVRFVEPPAEAEKEPEINEQECDYPADHDLGLGHNNVQPHSEQEQKYNEESEEDVLLMEVNAEEPYRPSPESPSPAPETDSEFEVSPEIPPRALEEEESTVVAESSAATEAEIQSSAVVVEQPESEEQAASVPVSQDVAPPIVADVASPPSPSVISDAVLSSELTPSLSLPDNAASEDVPPPPPAPAPVIKMGIKEWRARKKESEREQKQAEEREREQEKERERELDKEREREPEREREKDAQGENKENDVMPVKPEDGLNRILDGIRRSAVSEKPPLPAPPLHEDIDMPDVVPPASEEPQLTLDGRVSKTKAAALTITSFVPTGGLGGLSPLTTSSIADSRTPSPALVNGASNLKREPSPFAVNTLPPPPMLNGVSKPIASNLPKTSQSLSSPTIVKSVVSPAPATPIVPLAKSSIPPSLKASRYDSPPFTSNGVYQTPAAPLKSFPIPSPSTLPRYTNGTSRPVASSSHAPFLPPPQTSPPTFLAHSRKPSQEEGEILSGSSPPPPTRPSFLFGTSAPSRTSPFSSSAPPTQPRSHQTHGMQRAPPSAPKALREAQNPNSVTAGSSTGPRGGAPRWNGAVPQTIPASVLEPVRERPRRGNHRQWGGRNNRRG